MKRMRNALFLTASLLAAVSAVAQEGGAAPAAPASPWPANVTEVKVEKGKTASVKGSLDKGAVVEDLTWAANSSVACFPATQNERFRGNHVFYATQIPPKSIMKITVVPDDPKADMSIYAYTVGTTNYALPPKLSSVVSCEAEHKWDRPKKGKTQDHTRTVQLNAVGNPYNVVIAVAGPKDVKAGSYTLNIELQ
ncbi:MAG: hypothetical protein AB2A00_30435 [Myxococcota bacterium]